MSDNTSRLQHTSVDSDSQQTENRSRSAVRTDTDSESERIHSTCPECDGTIITDEDGTTICNDCGLVIDTNRIDYGPDWSYTDNPEQTNRRTGAPLTETIHDRGLSTQIGHHRDANGNTLTDKKKMQMNRLRVWNERYRTRNSTERNLKHALSEIDRMTAALGLPETVQETASVIYRRAANESLLPGHSIEGISTAAVYAAARKARYPRTFRQFRPVTRIDIDRVKRSYKYLNQELNLQIKPIDPIELVPQYISELSVTHAVEQTAETILVETRSTPVHAGRHPAGLAAGSIYLSSLIEKEHLTQREISDVSNISTVTIRNTYKALGGEYLDESHRLADRVDC